MKIYFAKPNTWFKEETEAQLIEYLHIDGDGNKYGLFEGYKERNGDLIIESEVCAYEDFNVIDYKQK
jgi:hypothetical protein